MAKKKYPWGWVLLGGIPAAAVVITMLMQPKRPPAPQYRCYSWKKPVLVGMPKCPYCEASFDWTKIKGQ